MADSYYKSINPINRFTSQDGLILDVNSGDLGNDDTSLTYFLLGAAGYNGFALDYVITATTLTIEASEDDFSYGNNASEFITAAANRNFSATPNWQADGAGASVAVVAGALNVTLGSTANTGAKLDKAYFEDPVTLRNGFEREKRYTVTFSLSAVTGGTIDVYAGSQRIASELTTGAAQAVSFQASVAGDKLSFVGRTASMTFTLDDVSITRVAAVWRDVTLTLTGGSDSSFTSTGRLTVSSPIPYNRMRIRRVTTAAANALELRLTRMKL